MTGEEHLELTLLDTSATSLRARADRAEARGKELLEMSVRLRLMADAVEGRPDPREVSGE